MATTPPPQYQQQAPSFATFQRPQPPQTVPRVVPREITIPAQQRQLTLVAPSATIAVRPGDTSDDVRTRSAPLFAAYELAYGADAAAELGDRVGALTRRNAARADLEAARRADASDDPLVAHDPDAEQRAQFIAAMRRANMDTFMVRHIVDEFALLAGLTESRTLYTAPPLLLEALYDHGGGSSRAHLNRDYDRITRRNFDHDTGDILDTQNDVNAAVRRLNTRLVGEYYDDDDDDDKLYDATRAHSVNFKSTLTFIRAYCGKVWAAMQLAWNSKFVNLCTARVPTQEEVLRNDRAWRAWVMFAAETYRDSRATGQSGRIYKTLAAAMCSRSVGEFKYAVAVLKEAGWRRQSDFTIFGF